MPVETIAIAALLAAVAAQFGWAKRSQTVTQKLLIDLQTQERQRQLANAQDEERHVETLARWQALLDATDDAILIVSQNRQVLVSNAAAHRLFALQDSPLDFTHAEGGNRGTLLAHTLSNEIDALFGQAVHRSAPVEAEIVLAPPSGRALRARITPTSTGEYLIALRDQTELRRLEVIRRDFVANVSHELRTPLTSVKAMAETLLDGALTDQAVAPRFLETIVREADRLVRLSSDLLDLSRVEDRGIEKSPYDLSLVISDVVAQLSSQSQQAGIIVHNTVTAPLVVPLDPDEIAQVLFNLLDNAITYTPRGGTVTILAEDQDTRVRVSVADTGIGVLSHDIPRIFERFYRVDKARSRASGGTGLGLSIVKHIVESHGGIVQVASEYHHGSTFTFTLPKK